jgi:hypothetical protein
MCCGYFNLRGNMKPYDYQVELADDGYEVLREHMMVYLAFEERTGKTLTSILIAEKCNVRRVLVLTKKKALPGWQDTLEKFKHKKFYKVTNYHQAPKVLTKFDLIILDEAHNYISAYPKVGSLWDEVAEHTKGKPIIYISATPHAQGTQQLFHQFKLSSWSPWKRFQNFYDWFNIFGKPYTVEINSMNVPQYDRVKTDKVLSQVNHMFITKTRKELGFEQEPEDVIHFIELSEATRWVYNEVLEHQIVELKAGMLVCDTVSKLRFSLHQLEGGTIKIEDERIVLGNTEKIDFILDKFGDNPSLVIMYNYIAEKQKLESYFTEARILQATSFAEGVDLYEYQDLVIYSQDFSTARHTQRRARQCNKKRDTPIKVHYLLVKKGISEQAYQTVSVKKKNFVDSVFNRSKI